MPLHRPDQPDALLDLAIIKHEARRRDLHGGMTRPLVDQQNSAMIGKTIQGVIQRHGMIALALRNREQPGLGAGRRDARKSCAGR